MKVIAISQRLDPIAGRAEVRDALDVKWARLLWDLGYLPVALNSSIEAVEEYLAALQPDGFILSGGNDIGQVPERDRLEAAILDYSVLQRLPVLGVCRGMQFINHYQGGSLKKMDGHVATRHPLQGEWSNQQGIDSVNSYHDWVIVSETLGRDLVNLANTGDGSIEALQHKQHRWHGIMWHPEREQPFSNQDIHLIQEIFGD